MRNFHTFLILLAGLVGLAHLTEHKVTNTADFAAGCGTMVCAAAILYVGWRLIKD